MLIEKYLFSYRDALKERKMIENKLEIIKGELLPKSPTISDMPKGSRSGDRMAEYMIRVDKIQRELAAAYNRTLDEYVRISGIIARVEDTTLRQLLEYRYISGYTWETIADAMSYSRRSIFNLKAKALEAVSNIIDDGR